MRNPYFNGLVLEAIYEEDFDLFLRLLDEGWDIDEPLDRGDDLAPLSPLALAAKEGIPEVVEWLLNHGAAVGQGESWREKSCPPICCLATPQLKGGFSYVRQRWGVVAKLLLSAGANPEEKFSWQGSPNWGDDAKSISAFTSAHENKVWPQFNQILLEGGYSIKIGIDWKLSREKVHAPPQNAL